MQTENVVLMQKAKESLQGKWGLAIGTFLVYMLMIGGIGAIKGIGGIASLIISGPLMVGMAMFSLSIARNQEAQFEQLFEGFKTGFKRALITYLIMILFIVLRLLLLIVPGIIAAISYSMTFYILAEDNTIEPQPALEKSKQMMEGNKMKFFYLGLRFFGLCLLC